MFLLLTERRCFKKKFLNIAGEDAATIAVS